MKLVVSAPAKINLSLDIVSRRSDGYHDVKMVMQSVSLCDKITLSDCENQGISISCTDSEIPCDESNIAFKAAEKFFSFTSAKKPLGISIEIEKHIPSQAGLAGGSADGAAVILALNRLLDTKLTVKEMCEIGAHVGADVPFCLVGGTMLAQQTGTTLSKLPSLTKCYFVIVKPEISISTAKAYSLADSRSSKGFLFSDEVIKMLYKRNLRGVSSCLYNDFESVLNLPEINEIKRFMLNNKALGACMSGSGSAVFGIFLDKKRAQNFYETAKQTYDNTYLCTPRPGGCSIESVE